MPIRRHLIWLAFSILLPSVIACGVALVLTYNYERTRAEEYLLRTTQALAESMERRFDIIAGRLDVLAVSGTASDGDLKAFWELARRALPDSGMWAVLSDADGQQLVNTLRPFGTPLPRHEDKSSPINRAFEEVLRTGGPVLSDMFMGPVTRKPTLAMTVAVTDRQGRRFRTLSAGFEPAVIAETVSSTGLPSSWLVGAFDRNMAIVARSRDFERHAGKQPVPALAEAMRASRSGVISTRSLEGINIRVAFTQSPKYGWRFAVGVPAAELASSVYRTLTVFAALAVALLSAGGYMAMRIGRRISQAVRGLVPPALGVGNADLPIDDKTGVAEADAVAKALEATRNTLRSSEDERNRVEAELKAARDQAVDILSSITDGFYALDGDWRFTFINERAQAILQVSASAVLGQNFFDIFPQVRDTRVHEIYRKVMADGQPDRFEFISPILKRWTSFSVYPAKDGGISVYFRDISQQKATEEALIAAKEDAERAKEEADMANRAKSQFLASASHDLRQPVQSLFFFHEVLANKLKDHSSRSVLETMQKALDALKSLLDGLLDISRLHAGTIEVEKTTFPVAMLLDRLEAEYLPRAQAMGVVLRTVGSTSWVCSDLAQLERVLRNLVDNALKYTPAGGAVVVGCRHTAGSLAIQVVDTGPGIPPEAYNAIFQEFVQLGNPERDRTKGLGLGLAIVRHLAHLLGHEVSVRSRLGHGTSFTVTVPLARTRRGRLAPPTRISTPHTGLALVVEDEPMVLLSMRSMLESWGWEVLAADSGSEAVRLVLETTRPPDVIIADYRLRGDETGVRVIRDIHGVCGVIIPAVVLTGDTSPERIAECAGSGFPLLHKPLDASSLESELAKLTA